jgi:serine phosphatase RsbU (regulator of sigma subunit)
MRSACLIIFLVFVPWINAQSSFKTDRTIDSLEKRLKTVADTGRIALLNEITWEHYLKGNLDTALHFANLSISLAEKLSNSQKNLRDKYIAHAYNNIGNILSDKAQYNEALKAYRKSLQLRVRIGDKKGMAASYNNLGGLYRYKGDLDTALEYHLKSLKIKEEIGDKKGAATSFNNIGNIYNDKREPDKALIFYLKSLEIKEELAKKGSTKSGKLGLADSYVSIGIIYKNHQALDKALDYYLKGSKIYEELGNKQRTSISYNNIGNLYESKRDFEKALSWHFKSLKLREELGDKNGIAASFCNIGNSYLKQGKPEAAKASLLKGLELATEINTRPDMMSACLSLSACDSALGKFAGAYQYHKQYVALKDKMLSEEMIKKTAEMHERFESEKKDKELIMKDAQLQVQEADAKKKSVQRNALIVGLGLMLVLALFIFLSYRQKKRANVELADKNAAINKQKELIEDQHRELSAKNKEITESIHYSQRIQQAILPPEAFIQKLLPQSFVLFKPKDIVSGDFYWVEKFGDEIIVAAVDCTGHGVPGAFMSFVAHSLLNEAVNEHGITKPAVILSEMRKGLFKMLHQTTEDANIKDGMDIAICSIALAGMKMEYAGAYNPAWIIRNNECIELKADKIPIGAFVANVAGTFTNHEVELKQGDSIYVFTDGYADQFGGQESQHSSGRRAWTGKKFMYKQLKELLLSIQEYSMKEQKDILEKKFNQWKGPLDQVDDVCVIGVRI